MKSRTWMWISAVYLLAALAITIQLTAQDNSALKPKHHQYNLYDFGTVPAHLGVVPGMGRFNPLARLLEAHRPSADPAQPK
jgi:hypothetical protein